MAEFKRQKYGSDVATILETDEQVLEILRRRDGIFDLIVHNRILDTDRWEDLTVNLKPEHFIELGNIADMTLCFHPDCPSFKKPPSRSCKCHPRNAA